MTNPLLRSNLSFPGRLFSFLAFTLGGYIVVAVVTTVLLLHLSTTSMRLAALMQDLVLFIFPAVATAMFVAIKPARFMLADRMPDASMLLLALATLFLSIPAMNAVTHWNESIELTGSLAAFGAKLKVMEDMARDSINLMMGDKNSAASLIISVIIIGVLAGVSEELFFRGTLQRLLITRPMNPHIAIWLTAVIFSLVHFQFFGFVPRVLLGAFFGYLAWWSGSVWLPAIIHAVNNSVVVITEFRGLPESLNQWGNGDTSIERIAVVISVMAVAVLAWTINRQASRQQSA